MKTRPSTLPPRHGNISFGRGLVTVSMGQTQIGTFSTYAGRGRGAADPLGGPVKNLRISLVVVLGALGVLALASPTNALYLYVPDVLVISSGQDADLFLTDLEASLGVQPSDDPDLVDKPELKRVVRLERAFTKFWLDLDSRCDPDAVFALMYLTTTHGIVNHTKAGYFADNDYLATITVLFAQLYFSSYNHYHHGHPEHAAKAWSEAFRYADTYQSSIVEDEFLGMNAHINYDLRVAIAALGTTAPDGTSRKGDMDRVNHVLKDVTDDVGYMLAKYYGPSPPTSQPNWGEGHGLDAVVLLEPIGAWREDAWNQAVLIESMPTAEARAVHDASMQDYSWTVAQGFQSPKLESPWPARLAYCQANP